MLTIRLTRVGKKKDPSFRVIVVESKRKVKPGNYLEMVGSYDPRVDRIALKEDRIKHWLSMGATVSDTVHNLLVSNKIIDAKKINILPAFKAAPIVEEKAPEPVAETAEKVEEIAPASAEGSGEAMGDNAVAQDEPAA
jgi:small subunit ribosomal protein S16